MAKFTYQFKLVKSERCAEAPAVALDSPEVVRDYWNANIKTSAIFHENKEHLVVFILNTRYKITGWNLVSMGSLNESIAHPREIFRPVIVAGAHSFILAHNHPSGDPNASEADKRLTRRISECSELFQIKFLDHVIMGDDTNNYYSFKENCLL